jgi:phospholipid/cholesterol/gamma-HCH transport system substrate-binding protein
MSRRTVANLVTFFVIASLFFFWAISSLVKIDRINQPYHVRADFAQAVGVLPGAEVDYLGVTYGTVSQVERITDGVRITMKIDHGKQVPMHSTAAIFRKSALGEQYVEFDPPKGYNGGGPYYAKNTLIPKSRTTVPLEFSELLKSASRLLSAIPPDAASTLVHEGAIGLQGRADSLQQLASAGDRISQMLIERSAALDRLATNNTRLTKVVTEHRDSLGSSLSELRQVADSLKNARGDTGVLLQRGAQLLAQTNQIVAHHKGDLDCDLKTLELVTDITTTPARLDGLRTVLTVSPITFDQLWDATDLPAPGDPIGDVTRWLRVGLMTNPTYNPAPQYIPPHELPAVATVPACVSPLSASAAPDFVPTSSSRPAGGLASTGGTALLGLGLGLLGAALILRETFRGVRSGG